MSSEGESDISSIISQITDQDWADGAFVINASGMLLGESGDIPCPDVTTLGVLVWGIYSSAEQIHLLLGDDGVPSLTHQTNNLKIFLFGLPGKAGILTIIAKTRTLTSDQMKQVRGCCQSISENMPADDANWMQQSEPVYDEDEHITKSARFNVDAGSANIMLSDDFDDDIFQAIRNDEDATEDFQSFRNDKNNGNGSDAGGEEK